jgi:hypothetical protein
LGVLEQLGQVVEADGDFGMVEPEARFIDGQRSLVPYMPQSILNEIGFVHWRGLASRDDPLDSHALSTEQLREDLLV